MIGSQFIHMLTTNLGRHTQQAMQTQVNTKRIWDKYVNQQFMRLGALAGYEEERSQE